MNRVELVAGIIERPADGILAWMMAGSVGRASRGGHEQGREGMAVAHTAAELARF